MRTVAVVFLLLCVAWLSQACSPTVERDSQENCSADFELMARGVTACEVPGDRCAYSRDQLTGRGALVPMGSADSHWVCTCGTDIAQYWCQETCDRGAGVFGVVSRQADPACSRMPSDKADSQAEWCCPL